MSFFSKRLTSHELGELRALDRLLKVERFKLTQVEKNTLLVHNGKDYAKTQTGLIQLIENARSEYVANVLARLGYKPGTPVQVDLETGKTRVKP